MKSVALLAVGAAVAMAQQLSDLPACGQTCVNNMIDIAQSDFGCGSGDTACYCAHVNFGYGVRDCTNESCPEQDRAQVLTYGDNYCSSALASAGTSVASSGASVLSSAAASATATGGGAQSTAISTRPLVATVTSDGSAVVATTGFSTIYSQLTGDAASAASSAAGSASSVLASASDSAASVVSSAKASASDAASSVAASVSSELASATGGSSGSPSAGAAPRMTAFPLAGAAGMAAWLFL